SVGCRDHPCGEPGGRGGHGCCGLSTPARPVHHDAGRPPAAIRPQVLRAAAGLRSAACERICERNAAQLPVWRGTPRNGLDAGLTLTWTFEMPASTWCCHRLAHNPEVAGSNPVPATSVMSRDIVDRCPETSFTP